jgi:hypothetical protein
VRSSLREIPHDINGIHGFSDFRVLPEIILESPDRELQALQCVKSLDGSFPNAERTYTIMLKDSVSYSDLSKANLKITNN